MKTIYVICKNDFPVAAALNRDIAEDNRQSLQSSVDENVGNGEVKCYVHIKEVPLIRTEGGNTQS